MAGAKFDPFSITDVTYKTVNHVPIEASILIPKLITGERPGKYPLVVRWHGGFWMTGHRLFADWFPSFVLEWALKHNAIVVTPDYRLLPEANGTDILNDMKDFFAWLRNPTARRISRWMAVVAVSSPFSRLH
jgi:acetyl esterase/lipase